MEAKTIGNGSPSAVVSAGTADQEYVSQVEKHPALCQRCRRQTSVFDGGPDHPDTGATFSCGIMIENMGAGNYAFPCGYFQDASPVIDAERCTSCPATRICQVIVPHGSWNPFGGKGVKACRGLLP
jgi:hypothetical protein